MSLDTDTSRAVPTVDEVANFYEVKTQAILRRFGPGPRIHYRTGFADKLKPWSATGELRAQIVAAQERVLYAASDAWELRRVPFGNILDVGCGVGGGAIFWAQEFGAHVTAATTVPLHAKLVAHFAAQANVESLVRPMVCDALAVPGENCFDAAIALDSSDSFPRKGWFQRLGSLLRRGGHVFIFDCFLEQAAYADAIDRHWHSQIGTLDEYLGAANAVGFRLKSFVDVSSRTCEFWTLTIALYDAEHRENLLSPFEQARCHEARLVHAFMRKGLHEGGLRYGLVDFVKD